MPRSTTPSFVHELPLKVLPQDSKELDKRLDAARQLCNACLSECLRRIQLIKQSRLWKKAKELRKTDPATSKKLYKEAKETHDFSEYDLHKYAKETAKQCFIAKRLDSLTIQKMASRAFSAASDYLHNKRGKPRFKPKSRMHSVEGKNNLSGIRFHEGIIIWNVKKGKCLKLVPIFDTKDPHGVEAHALACSTKYTRIIKKTIRGKCVWYAQLIQEGKPLQKTKNRISDATVGLDIGPSTIAAISLQHNTAFLEPFCQTLKPLNKEIGKVQKLMDRSRRATNPDNYNANGTVRSGIKVWHKSKNYLKLKAELAELNRKLATTRKCLHGRLVNRILALGKYIKIEKLSYRAFQCLFGKSVGFRAPGTFVSILRRKAESAGGEVIEFSTYQTKLSQTCHCGRIKKKQLSERWHICPCGTEAQRDLYSASLALFVENDQLDTCQAKEAWPVVGPLLECAVSSLDKLVKGKSRLSSFGLGQRQNQSHIKGESLSVKAMDVVGDKPRAMEKQPVCL